MNVRIGKKISSFPDERLCLGDYAAPKPRRAGVGVIVIGNVSHVVIDVPLFTTELSVSHLT